MKKSFKIIAITLIFFTKSTFLFSQETRVELGDKYFDQFAYKKAIPFYEEAIKKGETNWRIYANLGDCYYFTFKLDSAKAKYDEVIKIQKNDTKSEYLLKYAQCLQSTGSAEDKVIAAFQRYYDKIGKADKKIKTRHSKVSLNVENLSSINSDSSDFGTYIFKNDLYFSSSRKNPFKEKKLNKKLYNWNQNPYLDIYRAVIDRTNNSLKIIGPDITLDSINTLAHQGSVTISSDSTMFYSGGNIDNNKPQYNKRGTSILKLKKATWDSKNNKWIEDKKDSLVNKLDFNSYSIGNPAFSPNNDLLFFATCAPYTEAQGNSDIYYVEIKDGKYGEPKSVPGINTSGRESFPFVAQDSTLYFSSDGIYNDTLGLGLLDIYKVKNIYDVIKNNREPEVIHLNAPINSMMDDFAYFEEPNKDNDCENIAYFSSNWEDRQNAKKSDDIYRVKLNKTKIIKGRIMDSFTKEPLANATVQLFDSKGHLKPINVDSNGFYNFEVVCNQTYKLVGSMEMYTEDYKDFNSSENNENINLELKIDPCKIPYNKIIVFDPRGSDSISENAKKDIAKLATLLEKHKEIKFRIESFTDSKDDDDFNLALSQRRANATKTYLINEVGIDESQILSAIGYGEKCLLYSDNDINNMSSEKDQIEAHLKNRRSQILIEGCDNESIRCKE